MKILLSILMFSGGSPALHAKDTFELSCTPIENEPTFRISGDLKHLSNKEFKGFSHSFLMSKEFNSIKGCRAPWYEKFPMSGNYDAKFHYHEHEYTEGCILRFVFSIGEHKGRLWVYPKNNPRNRSDIAKANCSVKVKK